MIYVVFLFFTVDSTRKFPPQRMFGLTANKLVGKKITKGNPMYETIRTSKLTVTHPAREILPKCVEVNGASMFTQQQVYFYQF